MELYSRITADGVMLDCAVGNVGSFNGGSQYTEPIGEV
jgi:hypothetical protein